VAVQSAIILYCVAVKIHVENQPVSKIVSLGPNVVRLVVNDSIDLLDDSYCIQLFAL